jgi:hypothetical protein
MTNLAEALPQEQARCRKILEHVLEIGAPGAFLAMMLRKSLERAEHAAASGDTTGMLRAYCDLREYKE